MDEAMIEVRDLTRNFGWVKALNGVSFAVPRGQVVGLLGPNGAGKTTAMRIVTGYLAPTSGTALVDGKDVVEDAIACQRRIGYLPEGNPLYMDLRVTEVLHFAARMHGLSATERRSAVGRSIETAGLVGMERKLVGTMSKGFRQRVGLAQALLHEPAVLILDEPTSGLDPNQQEEMRSLVRRLGEERTVVLSTHILPEVEAVCDRVLIINEGRLVADGTVGEIRRQAAGIPTARVTVRGARADAEAAARSLASVVAVNVLDDEESGVVHVEAQYDGEHDRRRLEDLAAAMVERGLRISALQAEVASLESVFAALTMSRGETSPVPNPTEAKTEGV